MILIHTILNTQFTIQVYMSIIVLFTYVSIKTELAYF